MSISKTQKRTKIATIIFGIISLCLILIKYFSRLYPELFLSNTNNSIGVIGGADGPTAIFVASSINSVYLNICEEMFISLTIIGIILQIYLKKKVK